MNDTNTENLGNNNENIFIYIMLGIECLTAFVSLWTSYKMGHILLNVEHLRCCCLEFDNINLDISDSESISKTKDERTL